MLDPEDKVLSRRRQILLTRSETQCGEEMDTHRQNGCEVGPSSDGEGLGAKAFRLGGLTPWVQGCGGENVPEEVQLDLRAKGERSHADKGRRDESGKSVPGVGTAWATLCGRRGVWDI